MAAGAVLLIGLLGSGAGPRNGDAAVYAAQAAAGDFSERRLHLPYLWLCRLLGGSSWAMDLLSALCLACAVLLVGRRAGAFAAFVLAAACFAAAPFGEVEPVWLLCVAAAATTSATVAAVGVAVWVSPSALLALPWLTHVAGRRALWGAAVGVVLVATVSGLSAWTGDRGLLSHAPAPGAAIGAWGVALGPVLLLLRSWRPLLVLPALLGPADADLWLVFGLAVALDEPARHPDRAARGIAFAALLYGGLRTWDVVSAVRDENAEIAAVVASMSADDGLIAPWSVGVRASIRATGSAYGMLWRPPSGFLRDQRRRWCEMSLGRVVMWVPVEDPLEGCPPS